MYISSTALISISLLSMTPEVVQGKNKKKYKVKI